MSHPILVIGPSGTGKSTSVENLNHKETFIIKTTDKPMPFRGSNAKYKEVSEDNPKGNMYVLRRDDPVSRYGELNACIKKINENREDIKTIVIDDFQYLMVDEYMSKSQEKGFDKFAIMATNMWKTLDRISRCRQDLTIIVISHNDVGEDGISTMQSMGKMLRNTVKPEGKFTVILHTYLHDGQYQFLTQYRTIGGKDLQAKSPKGMFDEDFIPNDLGYVINKMNEYYNEEFKDDIKM